MEASRFDDLVRALNGRVGRRGAVGLLLAALGVERGSAERGKPSAAGRGGRLTEERGADAAGRRKRKRKPPACSPKSLERCAAPASKAFEAAVERCRPACAADPEGAACEACLAPDRAAAVVAARACAERLCKLAPASSEAGGSPRRGAKTSAAPVCQRENLSTCLQRGEGDMDICLVGAAAACLGGPGLGCAAIAGCFALYFKKNGECAEDFGCSKKKGKSGFCVTGDACCPHVLDHGCAGECCAHDRCERCVDGTCEPRCGGQTRCERNPNATKLWRCTCPHEHQEICGDKACCDPRAPRCETCVDGTCVPLCQAPKVCEFVFPNRYCVCPEGTYECGDTCCPDGDECVAGACVDKSCPDGRKPCRSACCGPRERCIDGRCKRDDRCENCPADFACCDGACTDIDTNENCGACGNACDRTQACHNGQCVEYCSLNDAPYTVPCDDGVQHWCCPTRSPVCCKPYGAPHCC